MNFYSASAASPVTSSNLKRSRSGASGASGSFVPAAALPKIHSSDLVLKVFTHKSLRRATHSSTNLDEFDDNERLVELGKAALDVAVAHVLFNKRPMLKPSEMSVSASILRAPRSYTQLSPSVAAETHSVGREYKQLGDFLQLADETTLPP